MSDIENILDLLVGIKRVNGLVSTWPQLEAVGLLDWDYVTAANAVTTASTVAVDLPNMSVTVVSPVRCVNVILGSVCCANTNAGQREFYVVTDAANTVLTVRSLAWCPVAGYYDTLPVFHIEAQPAGSYTYKLRWYVSGNTGTTIDRAMIAASLAVGA